MRFTLPIYDTGASMLATKPNKATSAYEPYIGN